jgi:ABC-type transport system involved in cytochrome bd biosynthesis fused ATPase/permease subunit
MRPDADLYVFDEPSSSLDAIAQNDLFERITQGCVMDEDGRRRRKTVIFVTHRMSTVRRANKGMCSSHSSLLIQLNRLPRSCSLSEWSKFDHSVLFGQFTNQII